MTDIKSIKVFLVFSVLMWLISVPLYSVADFDDYYPLFIGEDACSLTDIPGSTNDIVRYGIYMPSAASGYSPTPLVVVVEAIEAYSYPDVNLNNYQIELWRERSFFADVHLWTYELNVSTFLTLEPEWWRFWLDFSDVGTWDLYVRLVREDLDTEVKCTSDSVSLGSGLEVGNILADGPLEMVSMEQANYLPRLYFNDGTQVTDHEPISHDQYANSSAALSEWILWSVPDPHGISSTGVFHPYYVPQQEQVEISMVFEGAAFERPVLVNPKPPSVVTESVIDVDQSSATLRATVNSHDSPTSLYFYYGEDDSNLDKFAEVGSIGQYVGPLTFEKQVDGLDCGQSYFAQARADNFGGITLGDLVSFDTQECPQCAFSISPQQENFGASGGVGSVSVSTQSGCDWTASSNDGWITITSGSSGSGDGTVGYSVSENTSASGRSGTITIAGETFTVSQDGQSCSYSISPTSTSVNSGGGSGTVSVSAQSGCDWAASSNDGWITIASGSSGSGDGTVGYSVSENTSASGRTGTITIAGETFSVDQAGVDEHTLTLEKSGDGQGTVTSSPAGINCGPSCLQESATFAEETVVTLTASEEQDSEFWGWSGDCSGTGECSVTMSQARSVTATFEMKDDADGFIFQDRFESSGSAGVPYEITAGSYSETDDLDNRCQEEFGVGAGLADWAIIKSEYSGSADQFASAIGMPPHSGSIWVQRDGNRWHTDTRHYLFAHHAGDVPSGWAVHDHIDNYTLSLGSWYGDRRALCALIDTDSTFKDCPDCPTMVMIPAGTFTQGSPESEPESLDRERPQRTVNVPAFAMGQTEVTFDEWDACVADGGCTHNPGDQGWGRGNRPVISVSWNDAQEYVTWLSTKTGHDYRLPSESEREYATRAGTTGRFNTGDCITTDQANFWGTSPAQGCPTGIVRNQTLPVGSFAPNAFGLYDTHGNVYEWVQDCWNTSYDGAPTDGSAWMSGDCSRAVLRGGSWLDGGGNVRSAFRGGLTRGVRHDFGGFRVARSVDL